MESIKWVKYHSLAEVVDGLIEEVGGQVTTGGSIKKVGAKKEVLVCLKDGRKYKLVVIFRGAACFAESVEEV